MVDICSHCGKTGYLSSEGECFHCYTNPEITKIKRAYWIGFPKMARVVYWMILIGNLIYSTWLVIDNREGFGLPIVIGYVIAAITVDCFRGGMAQFPVWQEPLLNIIAKILFQLTKPGMEIAIGWTVFMVIGLIVQKVANENRKKWHHLNSVKKRDVILDAMDKVPEVEKGEWLSYCDQWEEELPAVEQIMDDLGVEEDLRQRLMDVFCDQSDEIHLDNETKYYYCSILKELLERRNLWNNHSQWMDPLPAEVEGFANMNSNSRIFWIQPYITEKGYEFASRLRSEVCEPYHKIKALEEELKNDLNRMEGECISIFIGEDGERKVAKSLQDYSDQIILLSNLRLEVQGESIENDFIVISPFGIYVLEVKNLGSGGKYSLLIEKDGRWSKVYGQHTEPMSNVVAQNERHILFLEKYINQKLERSLDEYIRVQGMVVLANDVVGIQNEGNDVVVRYTNVMSTIRNRPIVMKEKEMKEIAQILIEASLPPKQYPVMNGFHNVYVKAMAWNRECYQWQRVATPMLEIAKDYFNIVGNTIYQ